MLTYPTFVHLCLIKEGYRPNETLHYRAEQSEMNGTLIVIGGRWLIPKACLDGSVAKRPQLLAYKQRSKIFVRQPLVV